MLYQPSFMNRLRSKINRHSGQPPELVAIAACGLSAAVSGLIALIIYSQTAGEVGVECDTWPNSTRIGWDHLRPILVVFIHPRCPCSRASVTELERLLREERDLKAVVVMLRPDDTAVDWERGPLWSKCESINGIHILVDEGGKEALRFGAVTSGHACLFNRDGKLLFSGGITMARGHEGENRGVAAIKKALSGGLATPTNSVFGCALFTACEYSTKSND